MKPICVPMLLLVMFVFAAMGAGPNEEYVRVYSLIQQGKTLQESRRNAEALAVYLEAETALTRLKQSNPQWNPEVVNFRLRYLQARITELTPAAPVEPAPGQPTETTEPTDQAAAEAQALSAQIRTLKQDLERLQSDNSVLQAKLKEALSVRPAAADPKELERSQEQNRSLAKQIELLKVQLAEARSRAESPPDAAELKEARQAMEKEARRADQLEAERADLASRVAALRLAAEASEALRAENALLKRQLAELKAARVVD